MKKLLILFLLFYLNISCKKRIDIDENRLFIKGGIKSEIIISKIKINFPEKSDSVVETVKLIFDDKNVSYNFDKGKRVIFRNGKKIEFNQFLNFKSKNNNFHWAKEELTDSLFYNVLPMKLEKNYRYLIKNIEFRDKKCYFEFYIDKNGVYEFDDIKFINLSPI